MTIIGIDVGLTGGLAVLDTDAHGVWLEPMPRDDKGLDVKELHRLLSGWVGGVAYVERIFAMPKSGAHSMMVFGRCYGIVIGILVSLGIEYHEVTPQAWMKSIYIDLPSDIKGKDRSLWAFNKHFAKVDANELGKTKVHMGMAEAALIAEYGRQLQM